MKMKTKTIEELVAEHGLNYNQARVVASNLKELIVPAGAGSGKTKTLVTKVTELLKQGNSLDNFLVLTFTKKAASEMKDRIKKELIKANMKDMANKIDSANISTFDAFAYNFVKQNASMIGLSSDIELLDQSIFNNIKRDILDDILLNEMINTESINYDFIKYFTGKTDETDLVTALLNTYNNLLNVGKLEDLDLNSLRITNNIFNYELLINDLSNLSEEFIDLNKEYFDSIKSYFDYLNGLTLHYNQFDVPRFKWKDLELIPSVRKEIDKVMKTVNDFIKIQPSKESLKEFFDLELTYINNIINILIIYEQKLESFKTETNKYEFTDISNFLNKILIENESILDRQRKKFLYVFVDEYQDTSKVQTDFLNMLIDDNDDIKVLYVGDLKQSIYKFRDAKPDTFINKQKEVDVISLDTNYRSSTKVINFVNKIFSKMLDDEDKYDLNYSEGHIMESGNTSFNSDEFADVYLIEMYKDELERKKNDPVEEAFVIGNKIKELLDTNKVSKYSDIAILARNKSSFKIYLDVFKYLNIPIQIQVDQELKQTYLLKLVSNILRLASILDSSDRKLMNDKRFLYFSIARSELFEKSDFNIFNELLDVDNVKYRTLNMDSIILNKLRELNKIIKTKSNYEIIDSVMMIFNINEKIGITKKAKEKFYQIEYLYDLATTLSDLSINSYSFIDYIYELSYNDDIKLFISILEDKDENSVKVTNIHQSKGLEYNTLFVAGLNKEFNKGNVKTFNFNEVSLFNVNMTHALKDDSLLALNDYIRKYRTSLSVSDNLKEELRLLYVALTRAEKALYLLTVPKDDYIELNSFTDYLYMNDFKNYIRKENIITHDKYLKSNDYYLHIKTNNVYYNPLIDSLSDDSFNFKQLEKQTTKASIEIYKLVDEKTYSNLKSGTKIHLDFEYKNLNNPLVNRLYNTKFNNKVIDKGISLTEYEFSYTKDESVINGIIDLLVIYEDEIHIIDYKLRNLESDNYIKQLNTYKDYINTIYDKPVKMYLYAITSGEVKEL